MMHRSRFGRYLACSVLALGLSDLGFVEAQERPGARQNSQALKERAREALSDNTITDQQLLDLIRFAARLQAGLDDESQSNKQAAARMKERLLKLLTNPPQRGMQRMRQRIALDVRDPEGFVVDEKNPVFSGPQAGEPMPKFAVTRINGEKKNRKIELSADPEKRQLYIFQDNATNSLRGLLALNRSLSKIKAASDIPLEIEIVFLGDDPVELASLAGKVERYIADSAGMSLSNDGRDGPGVVGLNREVNVTMVMVKNGKVIHNFAMAQPLPTNPYVFGAVAELVDMPAEKVKQVLNADVVDGDGKNMSRNRR